MTSNLNVSESVPEALSDPSSGLIAAVGKRRRQVVAPEERRLVGIELDSDILVDRRCDPNRRVTYRGPASAAARGPRQKPG